MIGVLVMVYWHFRGAFLNREELTMISERAGLSMDPGTKVTYNGVEIGRVGKVEAFNVGGLAGWVAGSRSRVTCGPRRTW
jgi:phospholipid/cholesterol/gamma-HCH transport system substrate-binding protein